MQFLTSTLFSRAGHKKPARSIISAHSSALTLAFTLILTFALVSPVFPRAFRASSFFRASVDPIVFPESDKPDEPVEVSAADPGFSFDDVIGTANLPPRPSEGVMRCFGTFTVNNGGEEAFILRLLFSDGGVLKHVDSRSSAFARLRDLELRYVGGALNNRIERRLSNENFNSKGGYYEVRFSEDDIQDLYEFELWGSLDTRGTRGTRAGNYKTVLDLSIEPLNLP